MVTTLSYSNLDGNGKPAKVAKSVTWHTDHTNQEFPPKFTMRFAVELPGSGAGTSVCDMRAAYDELPDATKNRIKAMKTAYMLTSSVRADVTSIDVLKDQGAVQEGSMIQPLVQTHLERGTKSIWFHAGKTETILGMESEEPGAS